MSIVADNGSNRMGMGVGSPRSDRGVGAQPRLVTIREAPADALIPLRVQNGLDLVHDPVHSGDKRVVGRVGGEVDPIFLE